MPHLIPSHQDRPAGDPIFSLHEEASARAARGERIVNATLGVLCHDSGELAVLPTAARVVAETPEREWAAYAPIAGNAPFVKAVVRDQLGSSPELLASAVCVATPGGTGALRHAFVNYLEPGQALTTSSFYWGPYHTLANEADRRVLTFPMFGDGGTELDLGALERGVVEAIRLQGRVLLVLNDPCHNPTGYSMHRGEWRAVRELLLAHAGKAPITLLVDGAYATYATTPRAAMLEELSPLLGKVGLLFAWSASKAFTHYGLRVGALVACVEEAKERAAVLAALTYSCRGTWSNCNRGGLFAIARLLDDPALSAPCEAERALLRDMLKRRADKFVELARARGAKHPRYEGGFFVTVWGEDGERLAAKMRERGVYVLPVKAAVRIGLCAVAERDIERVVDSIVS